MVVPIHTRCPPGGPPPMHPCSPPCPHTHCSRYTHTLYHSAPTHLCNNRWEGDRDGMGAMTSWPSYDTSWPSLPRPPVTPSNTPCQPSKQGSTATRRPHTKGSSLHDQGTTPPRVVECAGAVMAVKRGHMTGTPPHVVQCAGTLMAAKGGHMTGTPPRVHNFHTKGTWQRASRGPPNQPLILAASVPHCTQR